MKVPILNGSRVNPSGQPNVQIQNAQTPQALLGASPARALADFGEIASGATALYKQQWDEENQIRVQDSVNKVAQLEQSAELDQKNGFRARRGSDVVGFKDEDGNDFINHYTNTIRKGAKEIEESLSNPIQRKMFQQRIAGRETAFNGRVQAYFLDQNNDYKAQVAQTTLETNATSLAMSYGDNATTQQSLDGIASAVGTMGKLKGWDMATTTNETLKLGSKAVLGAIDKMQSDGKTTDIPSYMQQFGKYLTPADQDKVNELMQKNAAQTVQGAILTAKDSSDLTSLDKIDKSLTSEDVVASIGLDRVNALRSQVITAKNNVERSLQVQADTRERTAKQAYNNLLDQVQTGGTLSSSVWDDARSKFEGTTFAGKEKILLFLEKDISDFSKLPFPQQAERIRAMRTTFVEKPTSNPKELQETLQTYERAFEARAKQAKNDPLGMIASLEGKPQPALNFGALLVGDGSGLTNQLNARMTKLAALQQRDGYIVAANPFYPEEIATIKGVLANGDDAIKLQVLSSITKSVKLGDKYDNALLNGALNSIAGDNPALRLAGFVQAKNLQSSAGANVASLVLAGDRVRKSKTITLPQDSIVRQEFNTVVGDAIPAGTQQHQDFLQLTQFIYAGLSAREGKTDQSNDSIDKDLLNKAVSLATGGIGEHAGRNLILPYGMDENVFANKLHGALAASAGSAGLNVDDINDSPLLPVLNAKQGQYFISDGQGGAVINPKTKRPLLVDINKVVGSPAQAPRNLMLERK